MKINSPLSNKLKNSILRDKDIIAAYIFGSYARSEPNRDIDLCLVLDKKYSNLAMSKKRLKYTSLFPTKFDISIFQQLPPYIKKRVLKEGKIILCKNEGLLYDIAFTTIKEFEMYKKIYDTYLESMKYEK